MTPVLCGLVALGTVRWVSDISPKVRAWVDEEPAPAGDHWGLIDRIPDDGAVLTEARFLPALAARARIYATEDWRQPEVLDGHYRYVLLRDDHPWRARIETHGYRIARVSPGVALWTATPPLEIDGPPLTPE